jgi:hypothetical protein
MGELPLPHIAIEPLSLRSTKLLRSADVLAL